eukprot:TRINITY_DN5575_c0_g1_i4.p1 TRINITY_DN5575_c0_g1~~TRINITY_DN5575_c0_g1_i4.p1  ORF type:complete len:218 (-),score=61.37 TRINITY_DN5575_c0_g1_i4:99-752(-)
MGDTHTLLIQFTPLSGRPQGKLEMWVEIIPIDQVAGNPIVKIGPPPPEPYELRVIVWETHDTPPMDRRTGSSDIYVTVQVEGTDVSGKTDTHWKSKDEGGLFNYRIKLNQNLPTKVPRMLIQVWDADVGSSNEMIGQVTWNLAKYFEMAVDSQGTVKTPKVKLFLTHPNFKNQKRGYITLEMSILRKKEADKDPVGEAQFFPNHDPELVWMSRRFGV